MEEEPAAGSERGQDEEPGCSVEPATVGFVFTDKKRRSLRKDDAYRRRIELVQDLEFPEACHRLKASPDGQFLFATGIHPPRVRAGGEGRCSCTLSPVSYDLTSTLPGCAPEGREDVLAP